MAIRVLLFVVLLGLPGWAVADDRSVRLHAPADLAETGLFAHILPRFKLKTQVRVDLVDDPAAAHLTLGDEGRALFDGLGRTWALDVVAEGHTGTERFVDWLRSEVGMRTITGYEPEGVTLFTEPAPREAVAAAVEMSGDAVLGHRVSRAKCTRCHAVDDESRTMGIGSTPSFSVLRSLGDWEQRFAAFYALNPHPAFTIIEDVTPPFPHDRPSPIVPIAMTLDEVEAVLAYVAAMPPADLGAPLQHQ